MFQYTVRRILMAIPVMFAILIITFVMARAIPGDPCRSILGEKATVAMCDRFTVKYGLDKPITVQFGIYMKSMLQGDFGDSIRFKRPVSLILVERLPMTIELGFSSMIIALILGVPAGIIAAYKRNSKTDVSLMMLSNVGVSMPVFFLGLILIYIFAVLFRGTPFALPPSGRLTAGFSPVPFYKVYGLADSAKEASYFYQFIANHYIFNALITGDWPLMRDAMKHLILPAFSLSTIPMAIIARMTRSSMLEVLGLDYIRTARAKGLPIRKVVLKHALRNALLPVVTIIGLQLGAVLSGAVLTETIFGLAGIGQSLWDAISSRDFPIMQGFVIVISFIYVFFNLLVDLSYAFLDPRIRLD